MILTKICESKARVNHISGYPVVRIWRNEAGNALMLATMALPVVIGAGGLATDTIQWTLWKRQIQRQADSAAMAGAFARAQGASVSTAAQTEISRHSFVTLSQAATIENAPTAGSYAGNTNAVRVVLKTKRVLPFSSMFLSSAPTVTAEATAAVLNNGNYCVIALESTATYGITMSGSASVTMGCGLATNSTAANAVYAGGSASIFATPVAAVGGLAASSNYASGTVLQPYSITQADPFASLPTPVVPTSPSCSPQFKDKPGETHDISFPLGSYGTACYKGMDINGTLIMGNGIYYIDGTSNKALSIGSTAVITGTNVTIILTSSNTSNPSTIATATVNGTPTIQLTASTTGTYAGILLYQDRRAPNSSTNKINGNSSSILQGAIYMPSQEVNFQGNAGINTKCVQIVSRRVTFTGNNTIQNVCPSGSGASSFTGTAVRLVG